jgi:hypothetical protein
MANGADVVATDRRGGDHQDLQAESASEIVTCDRADILHPDAPTSSGVERLRPVQADEL